MLELKDHYQNIDSSGALDLTFALRGRGLDSSERQIRSTRPAFMHLLGNIPPHDLLLAGKLVALMP
jgi:hypothetical protein